MLFIRKLFFVLESEYRFYGPKSGFLNLPGLQLRAQVTFILSKVYGLKGLQFSENLKTGGSVIFYIYTFWVNTMSKLPAAVHKCPLNQIENGFQIRDQRGLIGRGR